MKKITAVLMVLLLLLTGCKVVKDQPAASPAAPMEWVRKMNNIRNRSTEIVTN